MTWSDPIQPHSIFAAAIQSIFPDALYETLTLIDAPALPRIAVLVVTMVNELELIGQDILPSIARLLPDAVQGSSKAGNVCRERTQYPVSFLS